MAGYKDALEKHKIPFNESYVKYCQHGGMILSEIEDNIKELLKLKVKPDAIFAASDRVTTSCFATLKKLNLNVPKDMGLIGFTNSGLVELLNPSLSAVKQPAFEMGQVATELLLQLIESKRPVTEFETRVLHTDLIIRDSSVKGKKK